LSKVSWEEKPVLKGEVKEEWNPEKRKSESSPRKKRPGGEKTVRGFFT